MTTSDLTPRSDISALFIPEESALYRPLLQSGLGVPMPCTAQPSPLCLQRLSSRRIVPLPASPWIFLLPFVSILFASK